MHTPRPTIQYEVTLTVFSDFPLDTDTPNGEQVALLLQNQDSEWMLERVKPCCCTTCVSNTQAMNAIEASMDAVLGGTP